MEFLLHMSVHFDENQDNATRDKIIKDEREVADGLKKQGVLVRMWRVPCKMENWGLWRARDATHLHEIISKLPLYPWMKVTVHPLALHPVDPPGAYVSS